MVNEGNSACPLPPCACVLGSLAIAVLCPLLLLPLPAPVLGGKAASCSYPYPLRPTQPWGLGAWGWV